MLTRLRLGASHEFGSGSGARMVLAPIGTTLADRHTVYIT